MHVYVHTYRAVQLDYQGTSVLSVLLLPVRNGGDDEDNRDDDDDEYIIYSNLWTHMRNN